MIYLLCAAVIVAGFVLAFYLKREGERSYARHQEVVRRAEQREQMARLTKSLVDFRVVLVDAFTPAMKSATATIARLSEALGDQPGGSR